MQGVNSSEFTSFFPGSAPARLYEKEYVRQSQNRVYALAFWMTDNEIAAEELTGLVLKRAFSSTEMPAAEEVDGALVSELREFMSIGSLTLRCETAQRILNVRRNTLRAHLERAVVQLPATERMIYLLHDGEGYSHSRIARTLGITEEQSRSGLHQARLRLRELLASMS